MANQLLPKGTDVDAAIAAAIKDHETRLHPPVVPPVVTPPTTPITTTPVVLGGTSSLVVENKDIRLPGLGDVCLYIHDVTGPVTIRNVKTNGGFMGLLMDRVAGPITFEGFAIFEDADYAGFETRPASFGKAAAGVIQVRRIGLKRNPATNPQGDNCYGIALTSVEGQGDISHDWDIDTPIIEDVPLFHGFNTHSGKNITIRNPIIKNCARPIFITSFVSGPMAQNCNVLGAQISQAPNPIPGQGLATVTLVGLQGGTMKDIKVDKSYPLPIVYEVNPNGKYPSTWTDGGGNAQV